MEHRIPLMSLEEEQSLFGPHDRYVKQVARRHQVRMSSRGGTLRLKGPQEEIDIMHARVDKILELLRSGRELEANEIEAMLFDEDINAKAFIKWVTQTNFYELKYSDNKKLISFVDSLFLD